MVWRRRLIVDEAVGGGRGPPFHPLRVSVVHKGVDTPCPLSRGGWTPRVRCPDGGGHPMSVVQRGVDTPCPKSRTSKWTPLSTPSRFNFVRFMNVHTGSKRTDYKIVHMECS